MTKGNEAIAYEPDNLEDAIREIKRRGLIINTMYLALDKIAKLESKDIFDERPWIATKTLKKINPDYGKD